MRDDDMTHDICKGVLNGIAFDIDLGQDPQLFIPAIPCEVCGHPIWLGLIASTCGDVGRDIYEETEDGFARHKCGQPPAKDEPECPVCFPEVDEDEEEDLDADGEPVLVAGPVLRFLTPRPEWTITPDAR